MKNRVHINIQFPRWKKFRMEVFQAPEQEQISFDMLTQIKKKKKKGTISITIFLNKMAQVSLRKSLITTKKYNSLDNQVTW